MERYMARRLHENLYMNVDIYIHAKVIKKEELTGVPSGLVFSSIASKILAGI